VGRPGACPRGVGGLRRAAVHRGSRVHLEGRAVRPPAARRRRRAARNDHRDDGLLTVGYPYFEQDAPLVLDYGGTYVGTDAVFEHNLTHEWNHGIGDIVTALLDAGMTLTGLAEHDSVPWNALPGMMTQTDGEWRLSANPSRVACSFTIRARR